MTATGSRLWAPGLRLALLTSVVLSVATLAAQNAPDRSKPPALGATPQLKLPPVQKRTLSNGLPVWLVEAHEVPLVQVTLLLKAGGSDDPDGKFGLASLTAAMLDEGAGTRSALEIADEVEFLGAELATSSGFDSSSVSLGVPVSRLGPALAVMADVALRPTFPDDELERVRKERHDQPAAGQGRRGGGGADGVRAAALRRNASLRHRSHRHGSNAQELHDGGSEGIPLRDVSARRTRR